MADYALSCLTCGGPLDDDGACPRCGRAIRRRPADGVTAGREQAHVDTPPGGSLVAGRADRLGVFQPRRGRTNWFIRICALTVAAVFGLAAAVVVCVAMLGAAFGIWLTPHGGGATVLGIVIVAVSMLVLVGIATMFWLLARGDRRLDAPPRVVGHR